MFCMVVEQNLSFFFLLNFRSRELDHSSLIVLDQEILNLLIPLEVWQRETRVIGVHSVKLHFEPFHVVLDELDGSCKVLVALD